MLKRLGQWLSAVFAQWQLWWAWIGAAGAAYAMLSSLLPSTWTPPVAVTVSGIASAIILLAGSFFVWKQERDKIEELTQAAHLVLQGLPRTEPHAHNMDFIFTFCNEGAIPLEKIWVVIQLGKMINNSNHNIDAVRQEIDYLAPHQPYDVRFRFTEKPLLLVVLSGQTSPIVNLRLLFQYERTEQHRRCKAEDNVIFDPVTQSFLIASRDKPIEFPLPPSRLRQVWEQLKQIGG